MPLAYTWRLDAVLISYAIRSNTRAAGCSTVLITGCGIPSRASPLAKSALAASRPAARSYRPKTAILARFKGNNTRRPPFFSACVGMILVNNISARNFSRREVGGPAQRLQAGVRQLTGGHPTPTLDFFRAISAGECFIVIIVTLCGAKPNSLTPLGSVVLPLLKITM
jgi:hypothetical protein